LQLPKHATAAVKLQRALAETSPPAGFARWVEIGEADTLANWPVGGAGVFVPAAGWVAPLSLCNAWLGHPAFTLKLGWTVARVASSASGWRLFDREGARVVEADAVVLANAREVQSLVPDQPWPLHTVRGQISQLPAGSLPEIARVIAREGYVAPGNGRPVVGATYEHDDDDIAPRSSSDQANLARLEAILPGSAQRIAEDTLSGRASLRATLPDRLPLVGSVAGQPGMYVAAAYASRGVVWAGLLGEALADRITAAPLPLEIDLMRAIAPSRFSR
jgi:tRNA 5-methylaminomethyl-2-thiouridine biosynthesis bifunctional protein